MPRAPRDSGTRSSLAGCWQQPLDDAVGMLYILVIVLGLWTAWPPYPMAAALAATALVVTIDIAIGWMPRRLPSVVSSTGR